VVQSHVVHSQVVRVASSLAPSHFLPQFSAKARGVARMVAQNALMNSFMILVSGLVDSV